MGLRGSKQSALRAARDAAKAVDIQRHLRAYVNGRDRWGTFFVAAWLPPPAGDSDSGPELLAAANGKSAAEAWLNLERRLVEAKAEAIAKKTPLEDGPCPMCGAAEWRMAEADDGLERSSCCGFH
jgi:hypothetical protein